MPKYNYRCSSCKFEFEVRHLMSEVVETCIVCRAEGVERVPNFSFSITQKTNAGSLVKEFIEDTKREVSSEKSKLKEDYYD